jgi:hypothetical protein
MESTSFGGFLASIPKAMIYQYIVTAKETE